MQTLKGLTALLLVAAGVFTAVMIFNRNSEPGHEATMAKAITTNTVKSAAHPALGKTTSADSPQKNSKKNL
jgi:hypothetical protein